MNITMEPCWKYVSNTAKDQIYHVAEEVAEVVHALKFESREKLILEILDVIQSCITLLAILGVGQKELDKYTADMKYKNTMREYYDKPVDQSCDNCVFDLCTIRRDGGYCKTWRAKENA